jgi:hypothetical protein
MGNLFNKQSSSDTKNKIIICIKLGMFDMFKKIVNSWRVDVSELIDIFRGVDLTDPISRKMFIYIVKNPKIPINPRQYLSRYKSIEGYLTLIMEHAPEIKLIKYLKNIPINSAGFYLADTLNLILHASLERNLYKLQIELIIIITGLGYALDFTTFTADAKFNPKVITALLTYTHFDRQYLSESQRDEVRNLMRKIL